MKHHLSSIIFLLALIALTSHCARITGTLTGGEKDETPPKILKTIPKNEKKNFTGNKVKIYFDEYVQIKNPLKNLVISPPLKYKPKISPSSSASKYINIKLYDTLKKNTTYVFDFGKSIVDFNEGNILRSYKYVFSTGETIDSLELKGTVMSSYKMKKEKFIKILLYEVNKTYADSSVYKATPSYITSTQDTLEDFNLTYLSPGKYRLFALKDKNNDNKFSSQVDEIAFYDKDIILPVDTTRVNYKFPKLKLFKEKPSFMLKHPSLVAKNRIIFGYQGVRPKDLKIELMTKKPKGFKSKILKDLKTDTLNYWMTPVEKKLDSMAFRVMYKSKVRDTFTIRIKRLYRDSLVIAANLSKMSVKDTFWIGATTPIHSFNKDSLLFVDKDTLDIAYTTHLDTIKNRLIFDFEAEEEKNYIMRFLPGTLKDMFEESNDTLDVNLSISGKSAYGNLYAKIHNLSKFPVLIELINSSGEVVDQMYATEQKNSYDFEWLPPSTYSIKIIFDENKNKKWDTGNILKHQQPEDIYYFPPVEIRANWDLLQEYVYDPESNIGKIVKTNSGNEEDENE